MLSPKHRTASLCCMCLFFALVSCNQLRLKQEDTAIGKENPVAETKGTARDAVDIVNASRFVFPPQSAAFPPLSVALDTASGQLCKTYPWETDAATTPKGLPLCLE